MPLYGYTGSQGGFAGLTKALRELAEVVGARGTTRGRGGLGRQAMGARTTKDAMTKPSCRFPRPRTRSSNFGNDIGAKQCREADPKLRQDPLIDAGTI